MSERTLTLIKDNEAAGSTSASPIPAVKNSTFLFLPPKIDEDFFRRRQDV